MCTLEDVFFGICGCWRTTPRVATPCAVGKSCLYYKTYGCKHSTIVGAVRLPAERCSNCIRAAIRRGSAPFEPLPRRPSSISTSSPDDSRRTSSATEDTLDTLDTLETLDTIDSGNLNTYALNAQPSSLSLEVELSIHTNSEVSDHDFAHLNVLSTKQPQIRKLTSIDELRAEIDFPAEGISPYSPERSNSKALTPSKIDFNQNMFAHSLNQSLSSATDEIVSPDHGPSRQRNVVAEREKADTLKALNFAEQMLGTIQIKCGNSNALNDARRRSSARHSTMPGMRERGLYQH